jgi:phosphomannomutase
MELDQIFKAYDIRGRVGSELTPEVAERVGKAFGAWLPEKGAVAIGFDMRPDSQQLAEALAQGLQAVGREVVLIGQVTSDMIYFAVGHLRLAGGAMITASHNPGEYNGIKLCQAMARPVGIESGLNDIKDLAEKNEFAPHATGRSREVDITEDWIEHVLSFVNASKLRQLKLVVDAGNGMAGKIFPELEPFVPFEVQELYFELDGTFPNHIANPLEPKNLIDLQAAIKESQADVGVAFDGDGDRAVLVDEKGGIISGTVMTAMLAEYFLGKYPGATILYNAICGRAAKETIEKAGGKSIRTKVGHSFIKADMQKHEAVFAGEHSGHYYFKDNFNADSGLIGAVIALSILSQASKPLSELAAKYQTYQQITETNFEVTDKDAVMQAVAAAFPDGTADWLDGLTVSFDDAWINVRPSNTEPLLRLNAEAMNRERLDQLVQKVTKVITTQ